MRIFIFSIIIVLSSFTFWGCKDDFADVNTPKEKLSEPRLLNLFTEALIKMEPNNYTTWFYNNSQYYLTWTQATVRQNGNKSELNLVGDFISHEDKLFLPKLQIEEIRHQLNNVYSREEAAKYEYLKAICSPVLVYLGIYGTDVYGSLAYSEASKAPFTSPSIITPKYEDQQTLFSVWLNELDETINILSNPVLLNGIQYNQVSMGQQDFVYQGDYSKWAKFANLLKLKIAVRLLHSDKQWALQIAKEVVESPVGIMNSLSDDFIFNYSKENYHFNDPVENLGTGSEDLISFFIKNQDPRIRFLFAKNDYNSSVIQAFFDEGKDIPPYILELANYSEDGWGNKTFESWKSPGEPWVRYHGAPVDIQAPKDVDTYTAYFDAEKFKLKSGNTERSYQPLSVYNEEMVRGNCSYTFPSPPSKTVTDRIAYPWYGALCSSAETYLYLAELKLQGADLPEEAETYLRKGIELSVRLYDYLAKLNKIPYYEHNNEGFDALDETIALKEQEINPLLEKYKLGGSLSDMLEQVYIQQYIHFVYLPNELFVTVRRSGFPRTGSALLPFREFDSSNPNYIIPRRMPISALSLTDQMYSIKKAAYEAEGFTLGTNTPATLQTERVDYDKNAPAYGAGMN